MTVESEPGVVPMLAYADGAAAMDWLADVFGFRERLRMMEGNRLSQGEMETDFGRLLLASGPPANAGLGLSRLRRAIGRACATGLRISKDTGGCSCSGQAQIVTDPAVGDAPRPQRRRSKWALGKDLLSPTL